MARRPIRRLDLRREIEALEVEEAKKSSPVRPVIQRIIPRAEEILPPYATPLTDANWAALYWDAYGAAERWQTQVELRPGLLFELTAPLDVLQPATPGLLGVHAGQPIPEILLRIQQGWEIIHSRFLQFLALSWDDRGIAEDCEDEDGFEKEDVDREPVTPPPTTLPGGLTPAIKLARIEIQGRRGLTVLCFEVNLFGVLFEMRVDEETEISRQYSPTVTVNSSFWGTFTLCVESLLRSRGDHSFQPAGFYWDNKGLALCPQPSVYERQHPASLGEALQRMPTLLIHAAQMARLDRTTLMLEMVRFLRADGLSGPWWSYPRGYYDADDLPEDDPDSDSWAIDETPQILDEDDTDGPLIGRWKVLLEILGHSGGPTIILFADGSSLMSATHRTSYKSDVYEIELTRTAGGQFKDAESHIVYWGE